MQPSGSPHEPVEAGLGGRDGVARHVRLELQAVAPAVVRERAHDVAAAQQARREADAGRGRVKLGADLARDLSRPLWAGSKGARTSTKVGGTGRPDPLPHARRAPRLQHSCSRARVVHELLAWMVTSRHTGLLMKRAGSSGLARLRKKTLEAGDATTTQ